MLILLLLLVCFLSGCNKEEMEKDALKDGEQAVADIVKDALDSPTK